MSIHNARFSLWSRPHRRAVTVAALCLLASTGCSPEVKTHGYRLDEGPLAQIEPGQTTQNEVVALLGSPSASTAFGDATWYYISQRTERRSFYQEKVVDQDVITISFDTGGMVSSIDRVGLDQANDIELVERETPTSGNELTVWEQFVGNIGRFNPNPNADTP